MNRLLAILVALLVGAAVAAGLLVVGGPGHARKERNDQTRLDHADLALDHLSRGVPHGHTARAPPPPSARGWR